MRRKVRQSPVFEAPDLRKVLSGSHRIQQQARSDTTWWLNVLTFFRLRTM